jgi:hypothetical protein
VTVALELELVVVVVVVFLLPGRDSSMAPTVSPNFDDNDDDDEDEFVKLDRNDKRGSTNISRSSVLVGVVGIIAKISSFFVSGNVDLKILTKQMAITNTKRWMIIDLLWNLSLLLLKQLLFAIVVAVMVLPS